MNYWVLEVDMDQIRSCLAQYYNHSNNTQDQRLQAEQWLTSRFQQFGHARWKQGLAMILQCANHAASGDEYVQFFGLHLLDECLLDRTWIRENSEQDRAMAKQFLFEFLHTQHTVRILFIFFIFFIFCYFVRSFVRHLHYYCYFLFL